MTAGRWARMPLARCERELSSIVAEAGRRATARWLAVAATRAARGRGPQSNRSGLHHRPREDQVSRTAHAAGHLVAYIAARAPRINRASGTDDRHAVESSQRAVIIHYGALDTAIDMGDIGILACGWSGVGYHIAAFSSFTEPSGNLSVSAICRGGVPHPAADEA